MGEIAATSREQSAGIEQVNHAIAELNAVTQQNATVVEDARRTADALREHSALLVDAVGAFAVDARPAPPAS
jgi:methyl-accepting chemotaxis protein